MGRFSIGMTQEQVMEAVNPAPAGRYRLVHKGFLVNPNARSQDDPAVFITKAGGKMLKAKLQIISADPIQHGKGMIYNAVQGSFSFANLAKVIPFIVGTEIDTEAGVGTEFEAEIAVRSYTDPETGEVTLSNDVKKMYSIA